MMGVHHEIVEVGNVALPALPPADVFRERDFRHGFSVLLVVGGFKDFPD